MEEILKGFDSIASIIADRVISQIKERLPEILRDDKPRAEMKEVPRIVKGNKALAEVLGISPVTVCELKKKGVLSPAIKSEYGRVIIYDVEKAMACLNHRRVKAGGR